MANEHEAPKKPGDMTALFQLPPDPSGPSSGDTPVPIEKIDSFESIEELGMMDHVIPPEPTEPTPEPHSEAPPPEMDFSVPFENTTEPAFDPPPAELDPSFSTSFETPTDPPIEHPLESHAEAVVTATHDSDFQFGDTTAPSEPQTPFETDFSTPIIVTPVIPVAPVAAPKRTLDQIQTYSDQSRSVVNEIPIFYPFHLLISGEFGPYERDKLLLFITESPIGLNSADLDLQINAGRVLLPRISEYAGIKMIQDLRDSGLQFSLTPSSRDDDETYRKDEAQVFRFDGNNGISRGLQFSPIPVLNWKPELAHQYQEIDTIQVSQYFKAEMVEAEKSDIFQEVIDRMLDSLKQKARLKGGDALTQVDQKLLRLRLPSQYQVSIQATVLKKRV